MKKLCFFLAILTTLGLSGCQRVDGKFYKITFTGTNQGDVSYYYPVNSYPSLKGYSYSMDTSERNRYLSTLQLVDGEATYQYRYKVTLKNVYTEGNSISKYFTYNARIDFSDYGISSERIAGTIQYASRDKEFEYRYSATLYGTPTYGTITKYFTYGQQIDFTDYGIRNSDFSNYAEYAYSDRTFTYHQNYVSITLHNIPYYGDVTKQFLRGDLIDFSDYGVSSIRISDYDEYAYSNTDYYYRHAVTFHDIYEFNGTYIPSITFYTPAYSYVAFSAENCYDYYYVYDSYYGYQYRYFEYWYSTYDYNYYYSFNYSFPVYCDFNLYSCYN